MNNEITPGFYSVIPAYVRYDKNLLAQEKLLYSEISALTNCYGYCFATNKYFSNLYNCDTRTITRWITKLEKLKYIKCEMVKNDTNRVTQRRIYLIDTVLRKGIDISVHSPLDINVSYNNIKNNINTIQTQGKKKFLDKVFLTNQEYSDLINELGKDFTDKCIQELDLYKKSKNVTYANDYATIKRWVIHRVIELENKEKKKIPYKSASKKDIHISYNQRQYSEEFLNTLYFNK